jgi:hypothetical protein
MRCRSWRPTPRAGHDHAPGTCRVCWKTCWRKAASGSVRCPDCTFALAEHPSATIRRQLVAEPDLLPDDILELLETDFDASVQAAASAAMERRHGPDQLALGTGGHAMEDADDVDDPWGFPTGDHQTA